MHVCECVQGSDGQVSAQVTRHSKGCSCRKSNCLKKYCECFQAGIFCAQTCRCKDCRNYEGSPHLIAVMGSADLAAIQRASAYPVRRAPLPLSFESRGVASLRVSTRPERLVQGYPSPHCRSRRDQAHAAAAT